MGDAEPLFTNFDRACKGKRLTGTAVYQIRSETWTNTWNQDKTIWDQTLVISSSACAAQFALADVQRFSRHKKLETVAIYVDQPDGGVQSKIADFVSGRRKFKEISIIVNIGADEKDLRRRTR